MFGYSLKRLFSFRSRGPLRSPGREQKQLFQRSELRCEVLEDRLAPAGCDYIPSGYFCSILENKGNPNSPADLGSLYYQFSGTSITIYTHLNANGANALGANTDEKLCVDDETNPWAILLGGPGTGGSCVGTNTGGRNLSSGTLPNASAGEPDAGLNEYEYMLQDSLLNKSATLVDIDGAGPLPAIQRYGPIFIDNYTYFRFHFNNSGFSIESDLFKANAQITISNSGTNEVGLAHAFSVLVEEQIGSGPFNPAPGETVVATLTNSSGATATFVPDGTDSNSDGNSGNDCVTGSPSGTCSINVTSPTTGVATVSASARVAISVPGGTTFTTVFTNVVTPTPATKTWVDAEIDIVSDLVAINGVNSPHTITARVQQNDGQDAGASGTHDGVTGFGPAPNGTIVTFSLVNNTTGATFVGGINSCTTTAGICSVQINSSGIGSVDIRATTTFPVSGVVGSASLTRSTGSGGNNSADAKKYYVDAKIVLGDTAINLVGQEHTFTATVTAAAPSGVSIDIGNIRMTAGASESNFNPAAGVNPASSTLTVNSLIVGSVTANAYSSVTFNAGGATLTLYRDTDTATADPAGTGGSGSAAKYWVDAKIAFSAESTAVNAVTQQHTFTAIVTGSAPGGVAINIGNIRVTANGIENNCDPAPNVNPGSCSLNVNSAVPTTITANAYSSVTFTAGGATLTLSRDTDTATTDPFGTGGTGPAVKTYVAGTICATKYRDADGDGVFDANESTVAGWIIYIDTNNNASRDWTDGNGNATWDAGEGERWYLTDASGKVCFGNLAPGEYQVREVLPANYISMTGDPELVSGTVFWDTGATITPAGKVSAGTAITPGYFGGTPQNPKITVSVATAGQAGTLSAHHAQWIPLDPISAQPDLLIGNMQVATQQDPRTPGFWANKNGYRTLCGTNNTDQSAWRVALNDLGLRKGDGTLFTVPLAPISCLDAHTALRVFLLEGNAINMAYMLSVQLAAMQLNVLNQFVSSAALRVDTQLLGYRTYQNNSYGSTMTDQGVISIQSLINWAKQALSLAQNQTTNASQADRDYLQALKDAFDKANNNIGFVF